MINGKQAQGLLDESTPGPWELDDRSTTIGGRSFAIRQKDAPGIRIQGTTYGNNTDPELVAAAPELAETVAWLYGRDPDEGDGPDQSKTYYGNGIWYIEADPGQGVSLSYDLYRGLTPDEAIELGRSLINAAEEARL